MAGLILSALAGGMMGGGEAARQGLARMQESAEKLDFEKERQRLDEERAARLSELQNQQAMARDRANNAAADSRQERDISARSTENEKDRTARSAESEKDRTARKEEAAAGRDFTASENEKQRRAQLENTKLHIGATMAAARMQADRANTVYQTDKDGNLFAVTPKGGATPVTDASGNPFKPAKDLSQSAMKLADIYQQQSKLYGDMAKTDPINGKDYAAEARRYGDLAVGIISGKTPEPKFPQAPENAQRALLANPTPQMIMQYDQKYGPGAAGQLQGLSAATAKTATKAPETTATKAPEAPKKGLIDSQYTGNEDRSYNAAAQALKQQQQDIGKRMAGASGEALSKLQQEFNDVTEAIRKNAEAAKSKSIVIRD